MSSRLFLSPAELSSHTWQVVAGYAQKRINMLREQNDSPMDAEKTAKLRGQIEELKLLLSAGKEKPVPIRIAGQA